MLMYLLTRLCYDVFLISPAIPHSTEFNNLFNESKRHFSRLPKPDSRKIWENFDQELYTVSNSITKVNGGSTPEKVNISFPLKKSKLEVVNDAAESYDTVDDEICEFDNVQSILRRIQRQHFSVAEGAQGDVVPILNITKASTSDLHALLTVFVPEVSKSATRNGLTEQLLKFIPVASIQAPPTKASSENLCAGCSGKPRWPHKKFSTSCSWCSRLFCKKCSPSVHHYPRTGLPSCKLCTECVQDITQEDTNDWAETSIRLLTRPDDESVTASLGCAFVAMALGADQQELLRRIAKELHHHGMHTIAYNLISLAISLSSDSFSKHHGSAHYKQEMKLHFLASSILKSLAKDRSKSCKEKMAFALASKDAYMLALSMVAYGDTEDTFDPTKKEEFDTIVLNLVEERERKRELTISQHMQTLGSLWAERDLLKMLNFLKEITADDTETSASDDQESVSLQAFKSFLDSKKPFLSSMLPEDRQALVFLRGVLKLKEDKIKPALSDFESVAWNSSSMVSNDNILSAYLCILSGSFNKLHSYEALKNAMKSGSKGLLFSEKVHTQLEERSAILFTPSDEELSPPFKANWPSLSVVDHNTRCHQKYEEAMMKLYDEQKWSHMRVSCAFMDAFPGCEHPAEMVVCYLHAAMWMTKNWGPKSKISPNVLYGYKTVIMRLLQMSFVISFKALNPGMELYVIRLAIGIMRKVALVPDSKLVFIEEDALFLQELLKRLLKVSRMFPFWNPPSVSVSEAVMLNIITRRLHSNFILELQYISPKSRPLTELDLTYQLYENDLRWVLPLENSSDSRARAMDEMLKSEGWSWNDVRQTMSTQLCPRDKDGWIIQSPQLGVPQQYSDITGFVVDMDPDRPSLKLLVVNANPRSGRIGLFSQEDINTMLQLEPDELPLYFSLDPPSDSFDRNYHPFQQWRYATEKVKGTEVLNTMFITDYLMKSFTVGSDVSSLPPFKQRPCKHGLTKNLPPELQEAICSIRERGGIHSKSDSHRFWIETKEIKFDCQQNGSRIEFRFGEMGMQVKSHSLSRDAEGKLVNTDEDDDPESPHATFARDMTDHYSQLSEYFPVFARLRQLGKLQLFSLMLQSLLENVKEQSQGKGVNISKEIVKEIQEDARRQHRTNLSAALTEMKQKVGIWPKAQNRSLIRSKVDEVKSAIRAEIRQEEQRLYRQHGYNITIDNSDAYRMLDNVESKVIDAFRSNDEDALTQITEALKSSLKMSPNYYLKGYVRDWLASSSNSSKESLIAYLCSYIPVPTYEEIYDSVISHHQKRYRALSHLVNPLKNSSKPANSCKWVPAAISPGSHSISYGGVALYIKAVPIRAGEYLPRYRNETTALIQRKSTTAPPTSCVNYSAPKGNAESSSSGGNSNNNSWNDAGSKKSSSSSTNTTRLPREAAAAASNEDRRQKSAKQTKTATATKQLNEITKKGKSSDAGKQPVNASTFRQRNSQVVNNQLDRVCHGVNSSRPPPPPPPPPPTKPPGGSGSGGSGGDDGDGRNGGSFITGCTGNKSLVTACKSPAEIINPKILKGLPLKSAKGNEVRNTNEPINGLYVVKNTETGQYYVGRSGDVFGRMTAHQSSIRTQKKTVGGFISSLDKMQFCVLELKSGMPLSTIRYYEQDLMNRVKAAFGSGKLMNRRNEMNQGMFDAIKNSLPTSPPPELF